MTSYFVGDTPRTGLSISVPADWDDAEVFLDGVALTTTLDGTTATAEWPEDPFEEAGIYPVYVELSATGGAKETLTAPSVVVEDHDGWHTLATARAEWKNNLDDVALYTLLRIARVSIETYRPLEEDAPVPLRYRQAQLMQTRNVLNSTKTDPAQGADGDLFVIRPYPLDIFIRELIQPRAAVPAVG
jgi:hypothetical protein